MADTYADDPAAQASKSRKAKRDADALLKEIREAIENSWQHERDNVKEALSDLEFLAAHGRAPVPEVAAHAAHG